MKCQAYIIIEGKVKLPPPLSGHAQRNIENIISLTIAQKELSQMREDSVKMK